MNSIGLGNPSWNTGSYRSNSGISNATKPRPRSGSHGKGTAVSKASSFRANDSAGGWEPNTAVKSLRNNTSCDYNPITGAVINKPANPSVHRIKGLSEYFDLTSRVSRQKLTGSYQRAFASNPRTFHRRSGEFSEQSDRCTRSGGNPFNRVAAPIQTNRLF